MIYFRSDYSQGAHPKVMEALMATNLEHTDGYAEDKFSYETAELIKEMIGRPDAHIHFMIGGTPANTITISAALRPYECVITAATGHIYVHETGSIEATGHRVMAMPTEDGKLRPCDIEKALLLHEDEHTVMPRIVYISQSAENGNIYTLADLEALSKCCHNNGLYLYVDGARLGAALCSSKCDVTLKDLGRLADAFYIGGTKLGALFGEALVILNDNINKDFRYMIKRSCGMLAKGRLIAIQMKALLEGGDQCLYYQLARHENQLADKLADGIVSAGYKLWIPNFTNQIFPIVSEEKATELEKDFFFYRWRTLEDGSVVIRLVLSWGSTEDDVDKFLAAL